MNQTKQNIINTLKQITPVLHNLNDECYLIGASAMILSGVDIKNTSDVDILTSVRDAHWLKKIWGDKADQAYAPNDSDRFRSEFARYKFSPLEVEILGGLEVSTYQYGWHKLTINQYDLVYIDGYNIKIPSLSEQKRILTLFGRVKDLMRISLIDALLE